MRISTRIISACLVAACAVPATAAANSGQATIMQDDSRLLAQGDGAREQTISEFRSLGADIVKIQVLWRDIAPAPGSRRRPAGFNPFNQGDPGYNFAALDDAVRRIAAHGMRPYLALGGRSPDWGAAKRVRRYGGVYKPKPKEFGAFAEAVGRRYTGSYAGLPRVRIWSVWNEPNLNSWLQPQKGRGGRVLAASVYRNLYLAAHSGLRKSGHGGDTILIGELAPIGGGSTRTPPAQFLREVACLDSGYRPYRGAAARAHGCPRRFRRIPTSGVAHHPYSKVGGPRARTRSRDDVTIGSLSRLTRAIDRVARRGRLARRLPVYLTEFGFQTNPPDRFQNPIGRVPGYLDESEWIAFRNRRVRTWSQYSLVDDPLQGGGGSRRYELWQGGLRFNNGSAKPGVYDAFRFPFFARFLGGSRVEVWGAFRPGSRGQAVVISTRQGRGSYSQLGVVRLSSAGYFRKTFRVRSPVTRTFRAAIGGFSRTKKPVRR